VPAIGRLVQTRNEETTMDTNAALQATHDAGPSGGQASMRLHKAFAATTPYSPGRRPFFKYRDLGLEGASGGRMRAYHSTAIKGMVEPTGWHYHTCEMQFVFVMKGTIVLEFEDGTVGTFGPGDSFFVPGGVRHNEIYASEDKETLEVSVPGKIGTVNCERPAHLPVDLRREGTAQR
jgi:mannose-6-phosphate isomerase-like protein (cupin superfamily)